MRPFGKPQADTPAGAADEAAESSAHAAGAAEASRGASENTEDIHTPESAAGTAASASVAKKILEEKKNYGTSNSISRGPMGR